MRLGEFRLPRAGHSFFEQASRKGWHGDAPRIGFAHKFALDGRRYFERDMHRDRRIKAEVQGPSKGKTVVMGILERRGKVRTKVISDRKKTTMAPVVREHVETGSELMTDEHSFGWFTDAEYAHNVVNHAEQYVNGNVHTNGLENYWSLLKRSIKGTYVSVEPFHLFRYLDEQAFRYNNRGPMTDADRFSYVIRKIVGKRLTYDELIGKEEASEPEAF